MSEKQLDLAFEEYPEMNISILSDFNQLLSKKVETMNGGFDPHQLMVQKKQTNDGETEDKTPKQMWPEKDIKVLEEFCKQYGIVGFNCGRMSPIAALAMLKQKLGINDAPLQERIPYGYERIGSKNDSKKILLKG